MEWLKVFTLHSGGSEFILQNCQKEEEKKKKGWWNGSSGRTPA
jgi:hypothetical protein